MALFLAGWHGITVFWRYFGAPLLHGFARLPRQSQNRRGGLWSGVVSFFRRMVFPVSAVPPLLTSTICTLKRTSRCPTVPRSVPGCQPVSGPLLFSVKYQARRRRRRGRGPPRPSPAMVSCSLPCLSRLLLPAPADTPCPLSTLRPACHSVAPPIADAGRGEKGAGARSRRANIGGGVLN